MMFGKYFLVLLLTLCSFSACENIRSDALHIDDILNETWEYLNDDGFLGWMKFNVDGSISGWTDANHRSWTFDGQYFTIFDSQKRLSTKFVHSARDFFGKWHLEGRFMLASNGWTHYLKQQ